MLFDSERYSVYIGFAGIALSVDDVNQYWLMIVTSTSPQCDQYCSLPLDQLLVHFCDL